MATRSENISRRHAPEKILVVTGRFTRPDFERDMADFEEKSWDSPSARTVISTAIPSKRTTRLRGGKPGALLLSAAYECGGDFRRATLLTLIDFTDIAAEGIRGEPGRRIDAFISPDPRDIRARGAVSG